MHFICKKKINLTKQLAKRPTFRKAAEQVILIMKVSIKFLKNAEGETTKDSENADEKEKENSEDKKEGETKAEDGEDSKESKGKEM